MHLKLIVKKKGKVRTLHVAIGLSKRFAAFGAAAKTSLDMRLKKVTISGFLGSKRLALPTPRIFSNFKKFKRLAHGLKTPPAKKC